MRSKWRVLFFILSVLIATQHDAESTELEKVSVSEAIHGVFFLPMYVAQGMKFFEQEGLEVKIITAESGPLAMQALLAGEVQFCATGHGLVANMWAKGKSTKIVNQMQDRCTFYLLGRSEISDIKSLKGKMVGCTKIGAESYAIARFLVARAGLNPKTDVTMVATSGMATTGSALEKDRAQAVIGWQPLTFKLLEKEAAVVLARLNTETDSRKHFDSPHYSFTVLQVTDDYLRSNRDTVQRFVNALVTAEKWIASADVEALVHSAASYFQGMDDASLSACIKEDREAFSSSGLVTKEGHETVLRVWRDANILEQHVPFEAIVDNSFVEKALNK
jgi:NitT/TauT family transport system substrate-binding protein